MNKSIHRIISLSYRNYKVSNVQFQSIKLFPHLNSTYRPSVLSLSQRNFCSETSEKVKPIDENRDRRIPVDLELSIEYMKSDAFKETYQNYKIWELFRRNFKGHYSPARPRINCVVNGVIKSSNPCPVCRDRYLVLNYKNIDLLKHFISPHTGYVYPNTILCLCHDQYEKLCVAVSLAKNYGLLNFEVPLRQYDYSIYYKDLPKNFKV